MDTVDKLNHLIAIMENVPEEQLNMHNWYKKIDNKICCSALGWACLNSTFNKMGLVLEKITTFTFPHIFPYFNGYDDYLAAEMFFGITGEEVCDIFDPDCYGIEPEEILTTDVIERIEEVRDRYV